MLFHRNAENFGKVLFNTFLIVFKLFFLTVGSVQNPFSDLNISWWKETTMSDFFFQIIQKTNFVYKVKQYRRIFVGTFIRSISSIKDSTAGFLFT